MEFPRSDPSALRVPEDGDPDYDTGNPLRRLIGVYERLRFAAEREHYAHDLLQVLFSLQTVQLYGPRAPNQDTLDPRRQDFVDFQKQNVAEFTLGDTFITRGWVTINAWTGPFLRLSYRGGPDSRLSQLSKHTLGADIRLYVKIGSKSTAELLVVPYNAESDRYEIEIWGYKPDDLQVMLDARGMSALQRGELIARPDLVQGTVEDFARDSIDGKNLSAIARDHAMHPILPLQIEIAWADAAKIHWDRPATGNYIYEFSMIVRGWENFLKVGSSSNPHGGVGRLEYRNLLSNYFEFQASGTLGRTPADWSFDAFNSKSHKRRREPFMAVDYIDLHVVRPNAGIGLHRHRDNQEIFMVLQNEVIMVVGDWCEFPPRQRALELRTLRAGHFALLKPGQLHGLINPTDEDIPLLMFGGYD